MGMYLEQLAFAELHHLKLNWWATVRKPWSTRGVDKIMKNKEVINVQWSGFLFAERRWSGVCND